MKSLIASFPEQLRDALRIFRQTTLRSLPRQPLQVLVSGLGGSGIGGTIASDVAAFEGRIPVLVSKDYQLPAWANADTLVIISSYSGDTEETLMAMEQALDRGCMLICIGSGGKMAQMAQQKNIDWIAIPGGNPPRACLGYSLVQVLGILEHYGWLDGALKQLESATALIAQEQNAIQHEAEAIARSIAYSLPVVYCTPGYEGITIRFRQQLNENSKMLCWHQIIPEMNHNELVGWAQTQPQIAVLLFTNADDYYRNAARRSICTDILRQKAGKVLELESKGASRIERLIYWIHLGDWISWYAAVERNVDAMEIDVIHRLKAELAGLS